MHTLTRSRASYLAGLLRPQIIKDLDLHRHGLEYLPRDPSSFTPGEPGGPYEGQGLFFWQDAAKTRASIEQFSRTDADALEEDEDVLAGLRDVVQPLLDHPPLANETVRNKGLSGYHHCRACVRTLQLKESIRGVHLPGSLAQPSHRHGPAAYHHRPSQGPGQVELVRGRVA